MRVDRDLIKGELCRRSFLRFVIEFWDVIIGDKMDLNWHIPYLCTELEDTVKCIFENREKEYDLVVNICPATTKSTLISIMLPCWVWCNSPSSVILLNTVSNSNATKFSQKRRDIVTSKKFKSYFPYLELRVDSTALRNIKNLQGGEITQYTTKGSKTGDHGHLRIDDDPMSYTDAISESESKRCIEGYNEYFNRSKNMLKTPYIFVSQRLSQIDTTAHILRTLSNYRHVCLPAILNDNVKPSYLKDKYIDNLLDPKRLPKSVLDDIKKGIAVGVEDGLSGGEASFNAQYLQDTTSLEGLMYPSLNIVDRCLSLGDIMGIESLRLCFVDPAYGGGDYFVALFFVIFRGKIYVYDAVCNTLGIDDNEDTMYNKLSIIKCHLVLVESNKEDIFRSNLAKRGIMRTNGIFQTTNKQVRISSVANLIDNITFFNDNSDLNRVMDFLGKYPKNQSALFDDCPDALSLGMKYIYHKYPQLFYNLRSE